ncbi:hypothetical protein DV736_g6411, partial [Chaetothyriales sp. CBS 134916]
MAVPNVVRSKELVDASYQDTTNKKPQPRRKFAAAVQQHKRKRGVPSTPTDSSSSSSSSDAEDEASEGDDSDEDDEDNEEPLDVAPSVETHPTQTGRSFQNAFEDVMTDADSESMFDSDFQFQNGDVHLFSVGGVSDVFPNSDDENDDEAYKAVDDISDSDDDDVEAYEQQQLLAMLSDDEIVEGELLNQIDGLSEYGFGNESDSTSHFHSPQGSDLEHVPQRHVHFDFDSADALQRTLSTSPTISRALLPSALPEHLGVYADPPSISSSDDMYDSDATDEDLPSAAIQQAAAAAKEKPTKLKTEQPEPSPGATPKAKAKTPKRRGPPRGIFIDEGTKASGILDSSGKVLLITHPHLLGDEFAKRYGNSAPASPSADFQELLDGSDTESMPGTFDSAPLLDAGAVAGALVAQIASPVGAAPTLISSASSFAAPDFGSSHYILDDDVFSDDLGEDVIDIADVIKFDESDDSDDPTTPIYMPPKNQLSSASAQNAIPSFVNAGVTAFRNNADLKLTTFSTENLSRLSELTTPVRRAQSAARKRKRTTESPYASPHYAGVTPVQRMRDPNPSTAPATPDTASRPKRQRMLTT